MKSKQKKTALVVEGGGMRGVFSAGVLNAMGTAGFDPFDLYIGVSAGACNLASHLAGQYDRNYDIIQRYSVTKQFLDFGRFARGGHLMDLDWLWDITISEYRLDLDRIFSRLKKGKKEFIVVATSMESGRALYLQPDKNNLEHYLKVSSALPVFYRNILEANSEKATDGGVADSVPVIEAFRSGASSITVIRSRPSRYVKKKSVLSFLYPVFFRAYPNFARALQRRPAVYGESLEFIKNPPRGIRINHITPPEDLKIGRATSNAKALERAYKTGIEYGNKLIESWDDSCN